MAPWMALFPPGKGGGEGVAHGGKGKGILIHSLTKRNGMPLANRITPANGDERAQVLPLLDAVKVRTSHRGHPRKRLKVIAERTFAWFQKKYRRLVVRWERIASCFEAFLAIATIHIWISKLIVG
jgi:hypothetical protein